VTRPARRDRRLGCIIYGRLGTIGRLQLRFRCSGHRFLLYEQGITGKWLAVLKEIAPRLARAVLVANPKTPPL